MIKIFLKIEKKILKSWQKNNIFQKSINQRQKASSFVFYEGPPTANGKPGLHHVLGRVYKDIICRYKTMQGFQVFRKAGWDTHGLPVEIEVEKKLGLKNKKEIEKYGIAKFNQKCKKSVWEYKKNWEKLTERIAFWLDIKNPYITYESKYIETVWWIIKQIYQKNLLYKGYKIIHYCPRCGTGLSSHEVAQGYKKIKETAIYVKFKIQNSQFENCYFLIWTTTPWTLPGNVAIAVNLKITYVKVKVNDEYLILAKERIKSCGIESKIVEEFKGKDLIGLEYQPIFTSQLSQIIVADFVSLEEGTGLVHIAPAFGEEDMEVIKTHNLKLKSQNLPEFPILLPVDEEGKFKPEVEKFAKMFVKEADLKIIEDLQKQNLLFKEELYEHDYPFCWRCSSPLLYYAKESWFIKMQAIKEDLIKNNQKINWIPTHLKDGRFGEWLKEVKDWALSRERYWGTPLPIWQCDKCQHQVCIGSIKELKEKQIGKAEIKDLHRPYIDKIKLKCPCNNKMTRVLEVIDCWFDSGAMPFAQHHWPFNKEELLFPADYISEGIDQTRGWFYTLLAISTLLEKGPAYKNVISFNHILDEKGEKMSKSKGNIVDPWQVINNYGVDAMRWYFFTVNQPGDNKLFSEKSVEQSLKKVIMTLWNSYIFYCTYAPEFRKSKKSNYILNKWIISKLNELILETTLKLDKYDIIGAARAIESFIIDDLSLWYIRRSRKHFAEISQTLKFVLLTLSKLTAPFIPFLSEEIYRNLSKTFISVHLENWPKVNEKLMIDEKLNQKMEKVREIVSLVLAERAKAGIKVRQPLNELQITNYELQKEKELLELIKDEINVKKITFGKGLKLDTKITTELKEEGMVREVIRKIQEMRKQKRFKPKDKISIKYFGDLELNKILEKNKKFILTETKAKSFDKSQTPLNRVKEEIKINDHNLQLFIKK